MRARSRWPPPRQAPTPSTPPRRPRPARRDPRLCSPATCSASGSRGTALAFLATGPHPGGGRSPSWCRSCVGHWLDMRAAAERRQPLEADPGAGRSTRVLYALAAIQLANVALLARALRACRASLASTPRRAPRWSAASSGYSVITRPRADPPRRRGEQLLGRVLLGSVLYEHFYTEHLRGHHARVGTAEDPGDRALRRELPARSACAPCRRSSASAWRLEKQRLGDATMSVLDPRLLRQPRAPRPRGRVGRSRSRSASPSAGSPSSRSCCRPLRDAPARDRELLRALGPRAPRPARAARWTPGTPTRGSRSTRWSVSRATPTTTPTARAPTRRCACATRPRVLPTGYIGMIPLVVFWNRRFQGSPPPSSSAGGWGRSGRRGPAPPHRTLTLGGFARRPCARGSQRRGGGTGESASGARSQKARQEGK